MVCDLLYLEDWEEKAHSLTELISHKGVCRTAPATPGLLNMLWKGLGGGSFINGAYPVKLLRPHGIYQNRKVTANIFNKFLKPPALLT